jgi:hypothetical protein
MHVAPGRIPWHSQVDTTQKVSLPMVVQAVTLAYISRSAVVTHIVYHWSTVIKQNIQSQVKKGTLKQPVASSNRPTHAQRPEATHVFTVG